MVIINLVLLLNDFLKLKALTLINNSLQLSTMKLCNYSLLLLHLRNLDIQSIDVKIAYLYGNLDEKIYIEQPEDFRLFGKKTKSGNFKKYYIALSKLAYPGSTQ